MRCQFFPPDYKCEKCGFVAKKRDGSFIPDLVKTCSHKECGCGCELKKILSSLFIYSSPQCNCEKYAQIMDDWGPDKCEQELNQIIEWLRNEALKRNLIFIEKVAKFLVKKAINNTRKNQRLR